MNRAYSCIEFKSVDDDKRIIEGIASTPSTDRQDDIVEPLGAAYKLPVPLLWMHRSSEPIGWVEVAKVTKTGITIRARIAEAGISEDIDKAWQLIKAGLVRGLSIGFKPIETADIKGSFGVRYLKWLWIELSAVTIPANADASILSIKAADQESVRAASGHNASPPVVRLKSSPGASGHLSKGTIMTNRERIDALEAKRAATVARMESIDTKSSDEGRTFDDAEQTEFDTLDVEVKAIDSQLLRAKRMAELAIQNAKAVKPADGASPEAAIEARIPSNGPLFVRANVEKGVPFARYAMAMVAAEGNRAQALQLVESRKQWMDQTPQVAQYIKAAVGAGTRTGSGWADDLVYAQNLTADFVDILRPMTIVGRIPNIRRAPFNVRVGTKTTGTTGYWVGEGRPIPMSKFATGVMVLDRHKLAGLTSITEELALDSSPSAELMVRDDLRDSIVQLMDESFINPDRAEVTGISPASVTNGVTPVAATGVTAAALRTDIATLLGKFDTANLPTTGGVWIVTSKIATALSMMTNALGQPEFTTVSPTGGSFLGFPVIVSQSALTTTSPSGGNLLIFALPREIFLADDGGVDVTVSRDASLEMSDAPGNRADTGTGASLVSMFQNDSLAVRAIRFVTWKKRRAEAVQYINDAMYAA